jgi:mannose-6-phosphate isomerase-like protein (cupin superfamily)
MKLSCTRTLVTALSITAALIAAATISFGGGVPATVQYFGHDQVNALLAKGGQLVHDPGLIVLAQHRTSGPAEYHDKTNPVFIMVDGEATFVVGGKEVDPKRTAADQMRAPSLEGGTTYHLTKGDVITIPAKTWHWFKDVPTKTVSYYGVNIDNE